MYASGVKSSSASARSGLGVCAMLPILLCFVLGVVSCGGAQRSPAQRATDAAAAVTALQGARFPEAIAEASSVLAKDPGNSRAAAVRAIAGYQAAGLRLRQDLEKILESGASVKALDHEEGRAIWQRFSNALSAVDRDLVVIGRDEVFSLELCLACWEYDWNGNGEVDDSDRRLFELELDGRSGRGVLPVGDPRRRPLYRFDTGDAEWARAMVSFQRAAMELILAYSWSELDMFLGPKSPDNHQLTISLVEGGRVSEAYQLILDGLDHADKSRAAYLAEVDDDREWVPNPQQQSYAMPLAVDAALYQTWGEVTADIRDLLASKDGLPMRALVQLVNQDEEELRLIPEAFLDVGALLREPQDLVIDFDLIEKLDRANEDLAAARGFAEKVLRGLLGKGYATRMSTSPLLKRLERMKGELEAGTDTFDRKLRYLLWLN
jgi:hypothetical protein